MDYERPAMTQENEVYKFLGVTCLHCQTPIPVPSIIGAFETGLRSDDESSLTNAAVFNLRCPVCYKEKPYRTREIVTFKRTPQDVISLAQPGSVRLSQQGEMSRTAKA
jgi:hypothetical protein